MSKPQSEPWEHQVEPLKIKSALTRRGSKSKLRGPREFSPVIGSTKPRKAVTFDRTDEVITYEEITPEVQDVWRFEDQPFEITETFEQKPLHSLPAIPEQRGIDKSISEPSLHATLNENRMSRIERMEAVIEGSSAPSFRPGHKHKDSWRGSWGAITDSLGEQPEQPTNTGYSPCIEENYLFEQLPAVTRKESLQDDQRRPKTISMQHPAPPSNTLERTHSQRKRAIRTILTADANSNSIAPIAEEEGDGGSEYDDSEDEDVMAPEIPPHSPKPGDMLDSRLRYGSLQPRPVRISPSLESMATFEANFGSVEHAQSSPHLLKSFDIPKKLREEEFDFSKTRTSTPTTHDLPQTSLPYPLGETMANKLEGSNLDDFNCNETNKVACSPEILVQEAPLSPLPRDLTLDEEPHIEQVHSYHSRDWEVGQEQAEEEKIEEHFSQSSEHSTESEKRGLDLPAIPDAPVKAEVAEHYENSKELNFPELSMSHRGLDVDMFDISARSSSAPSLTVPERVVKEGHAKEASSDKSFDQYEPVKSTEPEQNTAALPENSSTLPLEIPTRSPPESDFKAPETIPPSSSQISIAGNGTYDFDSSTIAVHEKHYTASLREAIFEEDEMPLTKEDMEQDHDVHQASQTLNKSTMSPVTYEESSDAHADGGELDKMLENSVTQDEIKLSDLETNDYRPHPDFSFADSRRVTPLPVAPLMISKDISKSEASFETSYKVPLDHDASSTASEQAAEVVRDGDSENTRFANILPESVMSPIVIGNMESQSSGFDNTVESIKSTTHMPAPQSLHDSTSIEPLMIRPMDVSTKDVFEEQAKCSNLIIPREPSTNMISPPTPSMAFSKPGSRVTSGASTANNTVLHTPFPEDSMLGPTRHGIGLSDDSDSSYLYEKYHSPLLRQDDLVLDSDLSDYEKHDDTENEWVTDAESEFDSMGHLGAGSSAFDSEYSLAMPGRIPTSLTGTTTSSAGDIRTAYNPTESLSQSFTGPGFGTVPASGNSRWSIESLREDSFLSMHMGQSIDELSTDLNRVASSNADGIAGGSGYILRESDSLITANADRIFKTARRRAIARRKTAAVLESLGTHQEDPAEENGEQDQSLSVRKRNEQTSFTTRQPSHVVMSRNATPHRAYRGPESQYLSEKDDHTSGLVGHPSSSYYAPHEPSPIDSNKYPLGIKLPNRAGAEVEPTAKITEDSPLKDVGVHIDVLRPPPAMGRMVSIEEARETPKSVALDNFGRLDADSPPRVTKEHKPRPASSYTAAQELQVDSNISANISTATKDTYRNRHKSCPVFPQEKGHFFISVESVSGYELPGGSMTITLDNGAQQITTEPREVGVITEFNEEYDLLVHDGLTCDITIRTFKNETKEKRSSFAKLFKRKKEASKRYTPVAGDGTLGQHRITFSDIKQYAFGKAYSTVLPCYDRNNENQACEVNVRMMYVPMMSRNDQFPATMKDALEEIAVARRNKVTAMTGYMTQHGGDCRKPKRRYFILDDDMLVAHSDQSFKARATINLRKAVYLAPDENDPLKFRVNFRNGAFINFTVESERQKWMEALDTTIHNKRNRSSWLSLVLYANDKPSTIDAGAQPQPVI